MAQTTTDSFARRNLPPREQWPDLLVDCLGYPQRLNAVTELLDAGSRAARRTACVAFAGTGWNYAELADRVNRIANVLTGRLGMTPATGCCCGRQTHRCWSPRIWR